jgi:hypothetical protein
VIRFTAAVRAAACEEGDVRAPLTYARAVLLLSTVVGQIVHGNLRNKFLSGIGHNDSTSLVANELTVLTRGFAIIITRALIHRPAPTNSAPLTNMLRPAEGVVTSTVDAVEELCTRPES